MGISATLRKINEIKTMKIKELITQLKQFDGELEVFANHNYIEHCCGNEGYCYCSNEDHILKLDKPILVKDLNVYFGRNYYGKKKYPPTPPAVVINIAE